MRIPSHTPAATAFAREMPKPGHTRGARAEGASETATPTATETTGQKAAPPGLTRVLERLTALGEAGRSAGQNQAMDRIGRNLARYQEHQAMAPLPPAPPPADPVAETPVTETPVAEPPLLETPVAETPPEDTPPGEA